MLREYLKSLFDRHQTLDRQRRGVTLSRDDQIRLQYSPVRLEEVLVLNAAVSIRDANAVSNLATGPNEENADEAVEFKERCEVFKDGTVSTASDSRLRH